jgi:AhpC/TSA family protein/cytochrome c biogenesis DsbD-like protein
LAAISYDSVAVLKTFADRKHITYLLLSDPDSKIIRTFGILNETVPANSMAYGIPYPGTYLVDTSGKVVAKFFEQDFKERTPAVEILERFGGALGSKQATVEAKHLRLSTSASTNVVHPNQRVALFLDIDLMPKMHVYAQGVQVYIPIQWKMTETAAKFYPVRYPAPEMLRLEVIKETVPVYRGHVRLGEDVVIGTEAQVKPRLNEHGEMVLEGSLRYQACDDHECYIPETVPLKWTFSFEPLDRERVPAEIQRKPKP